MSIIASRSPLTADVIFARGSPAVVQVVVSDQQGRTVGTGSGFLISTDGLIATNYHVVKDAHATHVLLADETKLSVMGAVALDEDADLAIIKVSGQISARPLEIADNGLPPLGAKVYAMEKPEGLTKTLSDGLVSAHRTGDGMAALPCSDCHLSNGSNLCEAARLRSR